MALWYNRRCISHCLPDARDACSLGHRFQTVTMGKLEAFIAALKWAGCDVHGTTCKIFQNWEALDLESIPWVCCASGNVYKTNLQAELCNSPLISEGGSEVPRFSKRFRKLSCPHFPRVALQGWQLCCSPFGGGGKDQSASFHSLSLTMHYAGVSIISKN